ncbi:hypothetical protein BIFGAL_03038 [Bifidobacterium gallicum DSM 20093 = LMG 11596]|uniref:Uncharacterized protein n=1 Tax=Bifidobacterium gallicum DSM 20093 = LMG 11596 TaxID=561180 RepID=D1NRT9_9BIFI|nr:hypothetical protein BIFGAL_03038 [Bifidobacterium gallicum DSM 20093 = LMG 11596]
MAIFLCSCISVLPIPILGWQYYVMWLMWASVRVLLSKKAI